MKNINIAGTIGRDAETKQAGNDNVTSFSVAVDDRKGKEKGTLWFTVDIWGKRGDALSQYLVKGGKVCVSGDLSMRENNGKAYLTVRADQVTLMGGKQGESRQQDDGSRGGDDGGDMPF